MLPGSCLLRFSPLHSAASRDPGRTRVARPGAGQGAPSANPRLFLGPSEGALPVLRRARRGFGGRRDRGSGGRRDDRSTGLRPGCCWNMRPELQVRGPGGSVPAGNGWLGGGLLGGPGPIATQRVAAATGARSACRRVRRAGAGEVGTGMVGGWMEGRRHLSPGALGAAFRARVGPWRPKPRAGRSHAMILSTTGR